MTVATDHWVKPDPLSNPKSLERRFRARRFAQVAPLIEAALARRRHVEILDLGGTEAYWEIGADLLRRHAGRITVTLVNNEPAAEPRSAMFRSVDGNACDPALFEGRRFDLVHSNSVIEHVGDWDAMVAFSRTVHRLADRHFVQTPNYWFPLEPHFRVVGFQYLPLAVRAYLSRHFNLGFFPRAGSVEEAWSNVRDIRLLDRAMMRTLFPGSRIASERVAGLTKSIMAIRD
ncbi:SAM-dependent methyltransferase [Aureimonas flava]|uniref:SAM-dependent methyltransferase n=1 Tax=Aureimonas flava TaxID=2320271 RepID=A0A3A1WPB5_9HYPH|nr:methyltransferase domain-containing protein [Aureimonas flava]RIY02585.1 SAM-dependent methyltransferase [Aureimonas flava]